MKKQLLKSALIAVASVGLLAGSAFANSISGSINIGGQADIISQVIDFDYASVGSTTGTFDLIPDFDPSNVAGTYTVATVSNIAFDTTAGTAALASGTDVWSILYGTYTFTFSYGSGTSTLKNGGIIVTILGDLNITDSSAQTNYDTTDGTMVLTIQNGRTDISFSSTTSPVPEPATMLLFGSGIAGLAGIARRKKIIK